jgi:hypothetical protein
METERMIAALARDTRPVRRLRRPWQRTAVWAAAGFIYLALLIAMMPVRGDLALRLEEPRFLVEQLAALLTGLAAAAAAFATSIPGHRRAIVWAPLVLLVVWIGAVIIGVAQDDRRDMVLQADWGCVATILLGAAVPGAAMALMIRRGASTTPRLTAALAALAAAGVGNVGICVFHAHASNLVVLIWHCGTILLLAGLAAVAGVHLLRWPSPRGR